MSQVYNMINQKQMNLRSNQNSTLEWTIQSASDNAPDDKSKEEGDKANVSVADGTPMDIVMQSNQAVEKAQKFDMERTRKANTSVFTRIKSFMSSGQKNDLKFSVKSNEMEKIELNLNQDLSAAAAVGEGLGGEASPADEQLSKI